MIPRIFHFVFGLKPTPQPLHLMHYLCLVSCFQVNQPDAVYFHYHHEPYGTYWDRLKSRLIRRRIAPNRRIADWRYTSPYIVPYRYAHLSDFARLEILQQYGGVYADLDTLFVRPIPNALFHHHFVMGREFPGPVGAEGSLCNAWIASEPGASFGAHWLRAMEASFDGSWSGHSTVLPYQLACAYPDDIQVEPLERFFKIPPTPQGLTDLFMREGMDLESLLGGVLSLHLWSHLWWEWRRVDFSPFHAGHLTPAYVAHANTVYARLARPFLTDAPPARYQYHLQRLRERLLGPTYPWAGRLGRRLVQWQDA